MIDASDGETAADPRDHRASCRRRAAIRVINKIDLTSGGRLYVRGAMRTATRSWLSRATTGGGSCDVACRDGRCSPLAGWGRREARGVYMARARHRRQALERARTAHSGQGACSGSGRRAARMLAEELRLAQRRLGRHYGRVHAPTSCWADLHAGSASASESVSRGTL